MPVAPSPSTSLPSSTVTSEPVTIGTEGFGAGGDNGLPDKAFDCIVQTVAKLDAVTFLLSKSTAATIKTARTRTHAHIDAHCVLLTNHASFGNFSSSAGIEVSLAMHDVINIEHTSA